MSYMCQSQLSSDMLPSDAPMPPCAATVCERVGNTFDSTATDSPASASCSDARMPAPPAPTMIASNLRTGSRRALMRAPHRTWIVQPSVRDQHAITDAPASVRRTPTGFM